MRAYLKINRPINTSVFRKFSCRAEKWRNEADTCHCTHTTCWGLKSRIMASLMEKEDNINDKFFQYCFGIEIWWNFVCANISSKQKFEISWITRKNNHKYKCLVVKWVRFLLQPTPKMAASKAELMLRMALITKSYRLYGPYGWKSKSI